MLFDFMKPKFIDVHAHVDMCEDSEGVLKKAEEQDVLVVSAGVDHKSNASLLNLAKSNDNLKLGLGIYPTEAEKLSDKEIEKEINFIKEHKEDIVAISEVGLDLHEAEDLERQKKVLRKLVNLAKDLDKPIIVHSRKAEEETVEYLESLKYKKIIVHCFMGNMKLVRRIFENGWSLSIPSIVKYSEHFQNVVAITPLKNLFCETDSPLLSPYKTEKFDNEPVNVLESYKKIAEIKEISLDEVKAEIYKNFERVF